MRFIAAAGVLLVVAFAGCHQGTKVITVEGSGQSGGGSVPNGVDPKTNPVRGTPTASLPWSSMQGASTLGVGVRGHVPQALSQSFQATTTTVFDLLPLFVTEEGNPFHYSESDTVGRRVHAESNTFSVGVNGGFAWFKAGVSYRQSRESSISESTRDFRADVRLIKQRNFVSLADGHFSLRQDVLNRLANASAQRNAQDWEALLQERDAFEQIYGVGFVSEHVLGHSLNIRAYIDETDTNHSNVTAFSANFKSAFVNGDFTTFSGTMTSATSQGFSVSIDSAGLTSNPTGIGDWINKATNFSSYVGTPAVLWAGCVEYRDLLAFAPFYDVIPVATISSADVNVPTQTLAIPSLGPVGELVSLESYSQTQVLTQAANLQQTLGNTVWLAPYLCPGPYSSTPGTFTIQVRVFDLLKRLSRDGAFRVAGENFINSLAYQVAKESIEVVMPASLGGPASAFREHVGRFYQPNIQKIRPVLYVTQAGNPVPVRVDPVDSHWRLYAPLQIESFGPYNTYSGPGTNTAGLFFGANSLSMQFPDPNGDLAAAAATGNLSVATEVARGGQSVELSQSHACTGGFRAVTWTPPGIPYVQYYTGTQKVVLVRHNIIWTSRPPFLNPIVNFDSSFGGMLTVFNWQESQDITILSPGALGGGTLLGGPVMDIWDSVTGLVVAGSERDIVGSDRLQFSPGGLGATYLVELFGNRQPSILNIGTYQDILVIGQ